VFPIRTRPETCFSRVLKFKVINIDKTVYPYLYAIWLMISTQFSSNIYVNQTNLSRISRESHSVV
jgi:hypothetical protein